VVYRGSRKWYTDIPESGIQMPKNVVYRHSRKWCTDAQERGIPRFQKVVYRCPRKWYTYIAENGILRFQKVVYRCPRKWYTYVPERGIQTPWLVHKNFIQLWFCMIFKGVESRYIQGTPISSALSYGQSAIAKG